MSRDSRPRKCSAKLRVPKLRVATTASAMRSRASFKSLPPEQKMKSSTADFNRAISRVSARLNEASFEYLNLYDIQAHDNGVTLERESLRGGASSAGFRFSIGRVKAGFRPRSC